jgi:hypothetical protein
VKYVSFKVIKIEFQTINSGVSDREIWKEKLARCQTFYARQNKELIFGE